MPAQLELPEIKIFSNEDNFKEELKLYLNDFLKVANYEKDTRQESGLEPMKEIEKSTSKKLEENDNKVKQEQKEKFIEELFIKAVWGNNQNEIFDDIDLSPKL